MSRLLALVLVLATPAALAAQFDVTILAGGNAVTGHSRSTEEATTGSVVRPQGGFTPSLAVGYQQGAWRGGFTLSRATRGLVIQDDLAGISSPETLRETTIGLEIGHELVRNGAAAVTGSIGLTGTRWTFLGTSDDPRWRWGAIAALEGALPLARHFAMITRVAAARTSSMFEAEDLPEGYEPRAGNRFALSVGIRVWGGR